MSPLQALRQLQARSLVTIEDGEPCDAELLPALGRGEIDELQDAIGAPIPADIRELMNVAGGLEVDADLLAWNGSVIGQELTEAFPRSLSLMEDGLGNSWNIDIDPATGGWGGVYYICHDPAVVVFQAGSLAEFIIQFADDCCQPEREGTLFHVAERRALKVWDAMAHAGDAEQLRLSDDPVLRRAAATTNSGVVCDLRRARPGEGFPWGRFGPQTIITRPGPEAVWVLQKPAGVRRWWRRSA